MESVNGGNSLNDIRSNDDQEMADYLAQFKASLEEDRPSGDAKTPRRARHKNVKTHKSSKKRKSTTDTQSEATNAPSQSGSVVSGLADDVQTQSSIVDSIADGESSGIGGIRALNSRFRFMPGVMGKVVSVSGVMLLATSLVMAGVMVNSGKLGSVDGDSNTSLGSTKSSGSSFAIPREAVFAEAGAASRSDSREALTVQGDWGGIEDLEVPVTMSTADKKALDELKKTIKEAQKVHRESDGKVQKNDNRNALKKSLDEMGEFLKSSTIVESSSKEKTKDLKDKISKVKKDVESKKAADERGLMEAAEQAQTQINNGVASTLNASPSTGSAGGNDFNEGALGKGDGADVVRYAMQFLGAPYVFGGTDPKTGIDCSGLTMLVYARFGVSLPHYSGSQATYGKAIPSLTEAKPGDLIANGSHAAIYIGNGQVINALNPAEGVKITGVNVFSGGYSIRRLVG